MADHVIRSRCLFLLAGKALECATERLGASKRSMFEKDLNGIFVGTSQHLSWLQTSIFFSTITTPFDLRSRLRFDYPKNACGLYC